MELMLFKEESDCNKIKSCTVHTQTDFGPYSAFPPQRDYSQPSAPSSPDNGKQLPSTLEDSHEEGHSDNTNNVYRHQHQQDITQLRMTNTVERQTIIKKETSDVNGLSKERISRHSEEFELFRTSYKNAMEQNPWDHGETSSKISK